MQSGLGDTRDVRNRLGSRSSSLPTRVVCALLLGVATGLVGCLPEPSPTTVASPNRLSASPSAPAPTLGAIPTPPVTALPASTPLPTIVRTPDVALLRGPYLQSATPHSIIVVWETDLPGQGEISYGTSEALSQRVMDQMGDRRHAVTIAGLEPYTLYYYRIEGRGVPLSEVLTFRTAAGPNNETFAFVAIGDTRTQHQIHQAVAARAQQLMPDFVLHTGDLVEHGSVRREWDTFFSVERQLMAQAPLFPTLGNHEGNASLYFDQFYLPGNERWYSFDYGPARFICLQVDGVAHFGPQSEQYAWLEQTLATATQPWLIVALHIPPYSSLREDAPEITARETLTPLFERYGVSVVFSGHHHNYQRSVVHDVTYIVTGGGGAPIYEITHPEEQLVAYANAHHLVHVTVAGDTLTGVAMTPDGMMLDWFTLGSGEGD